MIAVAEEENMSVLGGIMRAGVEGDKAEMAAEAEESAAVATATMDIANISGMRVDDSEAAEGAEAVEPAAEEVLTAQAQATYGDASIPMQTIQI